MTGCTAPVAPSLIAGPYIVNISETSATVMFQTGGEQTAHVFFSPREGACDEDDVFKSTMKVEAVLMEESMVPYAKSGDLIPRGLYLARLDLPAAADSDRSFCYGVRE